MKLRNFLFAGIFLYLLGNIPEAVHAQQIDKQNTEWMNYLEELAESENMETEQLELLFEELSFLSEHPFNLNQTDRKELQRLPFLSEIQIENLLYYVYRYGPLAEIYELKQVEDLDIQTISYLLPFVYVGDVEKKSSFQWKNLWKQAKQEVLLRTDYTLQKKAGYQKPEDETDKQYLGEPYYSSIRYGFRSQDVVRFGFAAEKDAGESFWNKHHKGFDYYAANLNINTTGILRTLHLGDYRISFGQGLVTNTNYSIGQTADVVNIGNKNNGIKRHVSTNENDYFRGVAGTLQFRNTAIDLFYSRRRLDANVDEENITSFKTDGYHRTEDDWEKRKTVRINTTGIHAQWQNENFTFGATGVYYDFGGKKTNPDAHLYNIFYLREKAFFNTGIHYAYQDKKIVFSGETALDKNRRLATVNHLFFNPSSGVRFAVSFRNYPKDYNAFYAKSFGRTSAVRNERGIYFGMQFFPFRKWEVALSSDYCYFPWLKYGVHTPSTNQSFLTNIQYRVPSGFHLRLRYSFREHFKNEIPEDDRKTVVSPYNQHRLRIQSTLPKNHLIWHSQMDANCYQSKGKQYGWAITQGISVAVSQPDLRLDFFISYFKTDDWNTRINSYEKNILYAFSFPNYYGEGLRNYVVIRYKLNNSTTIYFKSANTHYFDRLFIGNDLEQIEGGNKTDFNLLIKWVL